MGLKIVKTYIFTCDKCVEEFVEETSDLPDGWQEDPDGNLWCVNCILDKESENDDEDEEKEDWTEFWS